MINNTKQRPVCREWRRVAQQLQQQAPTPRSLTHTASGRAPGGWAALRWICLEERRPAVMDGQHICIYGGGPREQCTEGRRRHSSVCCCCCRNNSYACSFAGGRTLFSVRHFFFLTTSSCKIHASDALQQRQSCVSVRPASSHSDGRKNGHLFCSLRLLESSRV